MRRRPSSPCRSASTCGLWAGAHRRWYLTSRPRPRRKRVTMARIHFIGICGTAMATLAAMLKARGHAVQGSDLGVYPPMSEFLAREGIAVFDGYRAEQITPDIDRVIVGNA